jgi:hypothetical protein
MAELIKPVRRIPATRVAAKAEPRPLAKRPRVLVGHMPTSSYRPPDPTMVTLGPPDVPIPDRLPNERTFEMLHVVLWKWSQPGFRETYTSEHANIVAAMVRRNLKGIPHRVIIVTDEPWGINEDVLKSYPLWGDHDTIANASGQHLPSCYRRLKLFDAATQAALDISPGHRVMWIDLDAVICGPLANIVSRKEKFVGWGVPGTYHPRVFNGSLVIFTAGQLQHIWDKFDPKVSPKAALKSGYLGSDQGWLSMNLAPNHGEAHGVSFPEVMSYPREVRRMKMVHPSTRIVFFHGNRKPWHPHVLRESPWISRFWHDRQDVPKR